MTIEATAQAADPGGTREDGLYADFYAHEDGHWWFEVRRRIVVDTVRAALHREHPRILDVGCGSGLTLAALAPLGKVFGCDASDDAVALAARRPGVQAVYGRLPDRLPFAPHSFDMITLLDVLEHVEEDLLSLQRLHNLLRPDGALICTVPAYAWLWSQHDVLNHHCRRYSRTGLAAQLRAAGFRVERVSYFNTLLFPAAAAARLAGRLSGRGWGSGISRPSGRLNRALKTLFGLEAPWLRSGASLPFGLSILATARREA